VFNLVSDETSQKLGIDVHKLRCYGFQTDLLKGYAVHSNTSRDFGVAVQPNYALLAEIAEEKPEEPLRLEFDVAREGFIHIGTYSTLDVADSAISALDKWYKHVLKNKGAGRRFLIEEGNGYALKLDSAASDVRYNESIIHARYAQAFGMVQENQSLDYLTVVSKIMPVFLQALGLNEYHVTHNLSAEGNGEVKFVIDKVATFAFYKPQQEHGPAFVERYSYSGGNYTRSFAGEAKGDILKKFVFEWLVDAARDMNTLKVDNPELDANDVAHDVRKSFVIAGGHNSPSIFDHVPFVLSSKNVVPLSSFRQRQFHR